MLSPVSSVYLKSAGPVCHLFDNRDRHFCELETIEQAYRSARTYNYVTKWDEGNITSTGTRLRFIVYRGHMSPDQDYWLRLQLLSKSAYGDIWRMNLIELVPRSVYDNPERPEDWW